MNTIVVFVKAPISGRVKTRLCPPLSPRQASNLYRAFAKDTIALARRVPEARLVVAYDALGEAVEPGWLGDAPFFLQEGPDLGARLAAAFAYAFSTASRKVVVIGSDTPHLDPLLIERAFASLEGSDAVVGPAADGGYYLFGLKQPQPGLFEEISWSTHKVLGETLERIKSKGLIFELLPVQIDIDLVEDLKILSRFSKTSRRKGPRNSLRALESVL